MIRRFVPLLQERLCKHWERSQKLLLLPHKHLFLPFKGRWSENGSPVTCHGIAKPIQRRRWTLTQLGLHEAISDPQGVGADCLPVHHLKQSELGRQGVHDHGQVALSDLQHRKKRNARLHGRTPML